MIFLRIYLLKDDDFEDVFTGHIERIYKNKIIFGNKSEFIIKYDRICSIIDDNNICKVIADDVIYYFSFKTDEDRNEFNDAINIIIEEKDGIITIKNNNLHNNSDENINFYERNNSLKYLRKLKSIKLSCFLLENNLIDKFIRDNNSFYNLLLIHNRIIYNEIINHSNFICKKQGNNKFEDLYLLYDFLKGKYPVNYLKKIVDEYKLEEKIIQIGNNKNIDFLENITEDYWLFNEEQKIILLKSLFLKNYLKIIYFISEKDKNLINENINDVLMKEILCGVRNTCRLEILYFINFIKNMIIFKEFRLKFFINFKYLFSKEFNELFSIEFNNVIMEFLCYLSKFYPFYIRFYIKNGFLSNLKVDYYYIRIIGNIVEDKYHSYLIENNLNKIVEIGKKYLIIQPLVHRLFKKIDKEFLLK